MVNRVDGVILSVGVVVLVASVIGVVLYDEDTPETFTVSWSESEASSLQEQTKSGSAGEFSFETDLNRSALAKVTYVVEVSYSGVNVNDDTVTVEAASPGGKTGSCETTITAGSQSGSGSCEVTVTANEQPSGFDVQATNSSNAREEAIDMATFGNGTGTWTTTVTIDGGGGEVQDPSYDITVTPEVTTWIAQPSPAGSSGRAG